MEHIKEIIKKNRPNLSDSSIKTYTSIVSNLYKYITKEKDIGDAVAFFTKHSKEVLAYLKDTPNSTRKTKLAALVVLCDKQPCAEVYRHQMIKDAVKYNDEQNDQEKTESQKENWVEQAELKKIYEELDKDTRGLLSKTELKPAEFQRLQNFIILSLYVLQGPRRLQDYTEMKLKNIDIKKDNYIDKTNLVFTTYKTAKFLGTEKIKLNPKLQFILNKWKKLNDNEYLLIGSTGKKFSSSQLQQRLNSILGRKASVNILRHSYLSDKYKDIDLREMEKDAANLGHSVSQQMKYIKKD